jgi:hypothetical protein
MRFRLIGVLGVSLILSACASGFVSSWKAPDAQPLQVTGSKVAAMVMMKDQTQRRAAEDALARELNARGAMGVAAYTVLPPNQSLDDEAAVRAILEREGFQGVVAMRPISTEKEISSTPPTYAGPVYGGFWGGYYPYGWGAAYGPAVVSPGEIRTDTIVTIETLVYSLRQNKLVWAGQSKSTNPSTVDRLVKETAKKAATELSKQGLLAG